jgi:hypothetical protein
MGSISDAIKINASVVPAIRFVTQWGIPAIVGESTYLTKNTPKAYTTIDAVKTDHGSSSAISVAAAAIFDQGVRKLYAVAMTVASAGNPTATETETALATLTTYASGRLINGVCLAGIGSDKDTLTAKLKTFADTNNVIFTVTNPDGATVANITAKTGALSSANGFFLAHNDADQTGDVAAAALGLLMALKPWVTPYWKEIVCDVNAFFLPSQGPTLEAALANYVTDLGDGVTRISQGLTTKSDSNPKFIDITRTKYYLSLVIQNAIATYRIATEKIPFTAAGLKFIEGEIKGALEGAKSDGAISDYTVTMPTLAEIDDADLEDRKLSGVKIWARLAGDIQEFDLDLILEAI